MTEDERAGWHHQLDGHEFEQALGDGDGQGLFKWFIRKSGPFVKLFLQEECLYNLLIFS